MLCSRIYYYDGTGRGIGIKDKKMENTGAVTIPQSGYEEWIENGCKKAAEIVRESEKEQTADSEEVK